MRFNAFSGMCDMYQSGPGRDYIEKVLCKPGWKPQETLPSGWGNPDFVGMDSLISVKSVKAKRVAKPCKVCGKMIQGQGTCGVCRAEIGCRRGETRYTCPTCGKPKNKDARMCRTCYMTLDRRGPYDKG